MANHLAVEQLIKARLSEKMCLIDDSKILSARDLEGVQAKSQINPAIHVLYADDDVNVSDRAGSGIAQSIKQLWRVVVVVRNVRDTTGESSRNDAGEIIDEVLKALQGWQPSASHSPLKRTKSPFRTTYRDGFAYFPFQFSTQMTVIGIGND